MKIIAILFFSLLISLQVQSQSSPEPIIQLEFWANYHLPGLAKNIPGNTKISPRSQFQSFKARQEGILFHKQEPKEVLENILSGKEISTGSYSLEFLLLHHVHTPLGFVAYFQDQAVKEINLSFSYFKDKEAEFQINQHEVLKSQELKAHDRWWYHCLVSVEENKSRIYINGQELGSTKSEDISNMNMNLALYTPESQLAINNILKELKVYDVALNEEAVQEAFKNSQRKIKTGKKYTDLFHFLAGPYLHKSDKNSINLLWEMNMPGNAIVQYGSSLPLSEEIEVEAMNPSEKGYEAFIQEVTLDGLEPGQKYFYNVKVRNYEGQEMESGVLSFKTAVEDKQGFQFAAIGDTETRPHINDKISKQIWGERPDFVIHMGDLTDGGNKEVKWQWNYEYFEGMGQLHGRIPVFPVPGNGEGRELYWYKRYHRLGAEEAFYKFSYGNAEFFMMNSNERKTEFAEGGKQYEWLEEELKKSDAKWKFVAMHHAPYSTDENDYGNAYKGKEKYGDTYVKQLIPVFEKYGVDIVFFGHLHSYSRMGPVKSESISQKEGVWYIQSGGAGGNLEDFGPTRAWFSEKVFAGHHYCLINIEGGKLVFKMYDLEGRLRDFMELEKGE